MSCIADFIMGVFSGFIVAMVIICCALGDGDYR